MFRTRDFVLVLTTVAFLVLAIGYTAFSSKTSCDTDESIVLVESEITTVSANLVENNQAGLSRAERLKQMQAKIKDSELIGYSQPTDVLIDVEQPTTTIVTRDTAPLLCPNYVAPLAVAWPAGDVQTETVEGVRQYYTAQTLSVGTTSSSSVKKNVLLALPSNFVPFGEPRCISADVVGVALDGSLIRNTETLLYGIFSNDTLIGYALDGYPIYGTGTEPVDVCGGRIALGQYRYELSANRDTILNCFAGVPQRFTP